VNANIPVALDVRLPRTISRTSPEPDGITVAPLVSRTAIWMSPLEHVTGCSSTSFTVRPALRTTIPLGFASAAQRLGGNVTSNRNRLMSWSRDRSMGITTPVAPALTAVSRIESTFWAAASEECRRRAAASARTDAAPRDPMVFINVSFE